MAKKLRVDYTKTLYATLKNNFVKNEFGYATFFDYYFQRYRARNILTEERRFAGKLAFVKMYFKLFRYNIIYKFKHYEQEIN